jgi:ATP-dependent helicase HrpA
MIKDKVIIQKKLHHPNLTQAKLDTLKAQVQHSKAVLEQRKKNTPTCTINTDLPIANKQEEITKLLQQHQIIIVCGETGSGKTTQLPQMCLQAGLGIKGKIAHTQPRRLAARTVAARIAEEMKQEIGQAVGYKIRFHDKTNNLSYIKLMTDGILLNEIHSDPLLLQYDTIIIDEAHERSLNIDFLLGYLKTLVGKRPDIKIIITSATIDPDSFAKHFQGAPILFVEGRTYPVKIYYRDYDEETTDGLSIQHNIHQAIDECFATGDGDILIFLATEKDIHETKKYLSKVFENHQRLEVLPLFSRLSQKEQNLIFHPKGKKRIVLATNVAETSVTVPGIDFVIDTGKARVSRYCVRSKIQRLPIEDISQASAKQRAGRCGRLRPGTVFRLYSQTNFDSRDEFTQAEILRTNLASVILQMKALNLG